uniref:Uncharacterized protein n=1 Tax=Anguilla anguilla TaxID=7936 RepID=A0A0E9TNZ6_ANGAN
MLVHVFYWLPCKCENFRWTGGSTISSVMQNK